MMILGGHPFLDHPLQPRQTDPQLVLNQLSHRPHPAIPKWSMSSVRTGTSIRGGVVIVG